jgi:CobQ/CobB/MinD/ParA nucleotide binding domain
VETLAFYSYKGGVGRSLLLANAARYLASLGRGVVVLDLDFEAPGLHYKLGRAAAREGGPKRMGGAVPYLLATSQGATSPPPFEEHMIEVPVPPGSGGWLRLMPAGPAPDKVYWAALKQLGEQVRFDDPSGQGLLPLLDLHARIEEELKPDYLLIDARTGVTELGSLATTLLADTVICMFVANQESLDGTLVVAEAVRAAPRLKGHRRRVRVVPVLARTTSTPPGEGPFAAGVERMLNLGEGREAEGKKKERKLFVLPHDEVHGAADRVVGGESTASAFSPLYKSYLELFRELFPSSSQRAQDALSRLEAVASLKDDLTEHRSRYGFSDILGPWDESAIEDGVLYESEGHRPRGSRYADLVCRNDAGRPLMVVEYAVEEAADEAKSFWEKSTTVRCLVLLCRKRQGGVERRIYSRRSNEAELRRTDRRDVPRPREFDLLPDVGDRSVEAMLDALRHGHAEAVALLISEWQESMAAVTATHRIPPWRPTQARRILDGLAATEEPELAARILHQASPSAPFRWRREFFKDDWLFSGDLDEWVAKDFFAPLFWRLPVEAALKYSEYRGHIPCLGGPRLLAEDLMGLRYEPDRIALAEGQALTARRAGEEQTDDREDWAPIEWLHRSRKDQFEHVRLSDEPPPLLLWEELLREDRYWRGSLEEAKEKLGDKARKALASSAGLRRRLRERRDRRELVTGNLLGQYEATGRLVLYSKVIVAAAELLGVTPRFLKSVVFIHLSVRALAHQAHDLDGQPGYGFAPNPPAGPLHRESPVHVALAQSFTHRLIERLEDANLMAAFEKLSQVQPDAYRRWISLRDVPLEELRTLLLRARASAAAIGLPGGREVE